MKKLFVTSFKTIITVLFLLPSGFIGLFLACYGVYCFVNNKNGAQLEELVIVGLIGFAGSIWLSIKLWKTPKKHDYLHEKSPNKRLIPEKPTLTGAHVVGFTVCLERISHFRYSESSPFHVVVMNDRFITDPIDFTAIALMQCIDVIREQYPELEEIKDKPTNMILQGTTKSGVSIDFYMEDSQVISIGDGVPNYLYQCRLSLRYEAPIKAEEDRQARIKRMIAESDF
jgi:hypothetical protein